MNFDMDSLSPWMAAHISMISSLAGSLTSAYFCEIKTWRERVTAFIFGAMAAEFLTPAITNYLPLGEKTCGYLMGFFGLNICAAFLKAIRRFGDDADFWTLLREYVLHRFGEADAAIQAIKPESVDKE